VFIFKLCIANISGLKEQHTKRVASTEKVDLTTEVDVGGDEGETRMILTKVHGITSLSIRRISTFDFCVKQMAYIFR